MNEQPKVGLESLREFEDSLVGADADTVQSDSLRLADSIESDAARARAIAQDAEAKPDSERGSSGIHATSARRSGPATTAGGAGDPHERWIGKRLSHFRIMRLLGQGTMGVVFQVEDITLKRVAALKVLRRNLKGSDKAPQVDRFLLEARVAASLDHPSIANVYEINQHEGWWYIAMEYLEGGSLQHVLSKAGPLPASRAALMLADAARGLAAAHEAGVIHRDIKPANLMLSRLGRCKLVDFGLVKVGADASPFHDDNEVVGTPHYMAPEVADHKGAGPASDIYSLGVTLFVLLTGETPYRGKTIKELLQHHISSPVPNVRERAPHISPQLAELIEQSMHKQPELRPTAEIFAASLQPEITAERAGSTGSASGGSVPSAAGPGHASHGSGVTLGARTGEAPSQPQGAPRPRRPLAIAGIGAGILAAVLGGLWAAGFLRAPASAVDRRSAASPSPMKTNAIGMRLAPIPAGRGTIGSPTSEPGRNSDERSVEVEFTRPLWMSATEVTQAEWAAVMGEDYVPPEGIHPNESAGRRFMGPTLPAYVSWSEAAEFCRRLSRKERAYYRLPTEAEWEYACRAGTTSAFHVGAELSSAQANIEPGSGGDAVPSARRPLPVASFPPNPWGLYDMHGNVMEWCADWKEPYSIGPLTDPEGPAKGSVRVLRGGSWDSDARFARSANRWANPEGVRTDYIGFRVVLDSRPVPEAVLNAPALADSGRPAGAKPAHQDQSAPASVAVDPALPRYDARTTLAMRIRSVGSDTMDRLMQMWEREFQRLHPGTAMRHEGRGTSTAVGALSEGFSNIGPMSRALKDSERTEFLSEHGYEPTACVVAMDALAVYVHASNPIAKRGLTLRELDSIFSSTRKRGGAAPITTWGDLGVSDPEWKNASIRAYSRNTVSGTYAVFKEIALKSGDYAQHVTPVVGSAELVDRVAADRFSIGYSGIGYHRDDVMLVPLAADELAKAIGPSTESAHSGDYPMARPLFVVLDIDPNTGPSPFQMEFLRFIYSREGQEIVGKAGFYPVDAAKAREELERAGVGRGEK